MEFFTVLFFVLIFLAILVVYSSENALQTHAVISATSAGSIGLGFLGGSVTTLVSYDTTVPFSVSIANGFVDSLFVDGIGLLLAWLTLFVSILCCIYTHGVVGFSYRLTNRLVLFLAVLLLAAFLTRNLLEFYIYFEAILIPMVGLVLLGSRGRKIHATTLFFMYTFASALFLLTGIVVVFYLLGTLEFVDFRFSLIGLILQVVLFVLFFGGFAAKVPLVPLHLWLPEAHVEAPTVGSVFLAAILLKLGTYGMFRTLFVFCEFEALVIMKPFLVPFLLISLIFASLTAIRQIDAKKIVAYSSVAHMSFSLLGLFSVNQLGLVGFLILSITHGLISAGMFFAVGMLYDRFHTRNVSYFGGLVQFMPIFSILYFLLLVSNSSLPGTCNFIGELLVLCNIWPTSGVISLLVALVGLLFTTVFCLILIYRVVFYQISGLLVTNLVDLSLKEFLVLTLLVFYIILFGLSPNLIFDLLNF